MASIVQTKAGTYRALIRRKGSRTLCRTFETRREAERWARQAETDLDHGRVVKRAGGPTVGEAIEAYRKLREQSRRDINPSGNEHYMLAHIDRDLGDVPVAGLTPERLATFCRRRSEDGAGRYTVGMEVSKLGTALKYAAVALRADWGDPVGAARPLLDHLQLIGPGDARDRRPTADELAAVRAATSPLMRDIIDFAIATCLRRGEIVRVRWSDVDEGKRLLLVRDRKHPRQTVGNDASIPLLGESLDIIKRQPKRDDEDRIFPVIPEWISDSFLLACRVAHVEGLHFHDLRHEGISRLFEAGYAIEQVSLVSGHRSWQQLRRYTQLRPESLHALASRRDTRPSP